MQGQGLDSKTRGGGWGGENCQQRPAGKIGQLDRHLFPKVVDKDVGA